MSTADVQQYKGKLKDSIYWWLSKRKPFIVNGQYQIELLYLDREHYSAKIRVTNLQTGEVQDIEESSDDFQ